MGKYIRKGKITGEVSVMDIATHHHHHNNHHLSSSLGVRTRAKTKSLALQRLQNPKPSPCCSSSSSSSSSKSSSCYLQLRSRRLQRCLASNTHKGSNPRVVPSPAKSEGSKKEEIEVSFGENVVDVEGRGSRNSRETTPCSLIRRDSDSIGTPGSTTRPASTTANNSRVQSSTRRNIPTSCEMEEFFAVPEQRQQQAFAEKYNFDPAKDCPLPGRYEWVKLENSKAA